MFDVLTEHLHALALAVKPHGIVLTVAGGFGLVLRERELARRGASTLRKTPMTRSTEDLDVLLTAEMIVDAVCLSALRNTLDSLCTPPLGLGSTASLGSRTRRPLSSPALRHGRKTSWSSPHFCVGKTPASGSRRSLVAAGMTPRATSASLPASGRPSPSIRWSGGSSTPPPARTFYGRRRALGM